MDYIILQTKASGKVTVESVLLVLLDLYDDWLTAFPAARRTAAYTKLAMVQHAGLIPLRYFYSDNAKEFIKALRSLAIPHETSPPYEHQANGLIETHNRIEIFGSRCSFEQCGAPVCFWPWACQHLAFSRNIHMIGEKDSPYERRFGKGPFPGLRIPFFARVRFK